MVLEADSGGRIGHFGNSADRILRGRRWWFVSRFQFFFGEQDESCAEADHDDARP